MDTSPAYADTPSIKVNVAVATGQTAPAAVSLVIEEHGVRLARTATGLVVTGSGQSWFSVGSEPGVIQGLLATEQADEADRDLFLCALLVALRAMGVHALHAAALYRDERALVLVGDSGAGKSTTATALACAGCSYLGDDTILLQRRSNDVELLAYGQSFRLTDNALASFTALRPHVSKGASDFKWRLDSSTAFPGRHLTHWRGPTTLLFLTRSARRESSLSSLTIAEATGLLIAQSGALCLECHPDPRQHLDLLALLANRAQLERLELGHEWLADPTAAAHKLLDRVHRLAKRQQRGLP